MDAPFVEEEQKSMQNVIALHVNIRAPDPSSIVVTGNASSVVNHKSNNMSRSVYSSKRLTNVSGRTRSASVGRDKKSDLRAGYWAFLFENLRHAIDGLYQTCESDENISECKEVILVLENYIREFHNLAEWFRVKWEYENTPPPQRPNSLAWDIRKSSPGKVFRKSCQPKLDGAACRELIFELNNVSKTRNVESLVNNSSTNSKLKFANANTINERISEHGSDCEPGDPSPLTVDPAVLEFQVGKTKTKSKSVECATQTDDSVSSQLPAKKSIANVVGRKITGIGGGTPYTKKIVRNFSISAAPEKNTPIPLSLSTKRLSGYISPRKPTPGRNIAAPVFVPGKKINLNAAPKSYGGPLESSTSDVTKIKISRSQSDSAFETSSVSTFRSSSLKTTSEKPYASVECVKSDAKDEPASKSLSTVSMAIINEAQYVENKVEMPNSNADSCCAVADDSDATTTAHLVPDSGIGRVPSIGKDTDEDVAKSVDTIINVSGEKEKIQQSDVTERENLTAEKKVADAKTEGSTNDDVRVAIETTTEVNNENDAIASTETEKKIDIVKKIPLKINVVRSPSHRTQKVTAEAYQQLAPDKKRNLATRVISARTNQIRYAKDCVALRKPYENAKAVRVLVVVDDDSKTRNVRSQANDDGNVKSKPIEKDDSDKKYAKISYSNVSRSNFHKEAAAAAAFHYRRNAKDSPKYAANMIRSKTSVDMTSNKSRPVAAGMSEDARTKTSEERDSPPRHRRSSKDIDGWETVISRSRRSIPNSINGKHKAYDISKRFYEPSPSTSLPALTTLTTFGTAKHESKEKSPASDKKSESKNKNRNRNYSHSGGSGGGSNNSKEASADNNGSSPKNVYDSYTLSNERPIITSTAMFTTILQSKQRRKPNNEKESKKATKITNKANNNKSPKCKSCKAFVNEQLNDDDLLNEESLRKSKELHETEISLQKEIHDLQNSDADTDTTEDGDSDGTEIDPELVDLCTNKEKTNPDERRAVLETKYNHILANMTWSEQVETLNKLEELLDRDPSGKTLKFVKNFTSLKQFEDLVTRSPGRALELHQKLSSPSRKRISPDSTILQHKARQAKAKQNREQLLQDKSAKIRELFNKVSEVKAMQTQLSDERRERRKLLDQKLKRAEENRNLYLKNIQEKAHDEAKKQKEIAFINELEAQNKRHDFYALRQEQEDRLLSILEDRQRRQEEKAAKEAAVEERRKAIEAERQEKIEELQVKMRKREERIDRELQEKERERIKMAREKARDREDRLLALQAAQIANAEELQKKIQQKQEDSARRHEETIELRRQRAMEIGTPRLTPYQINKLCSVCNVVIDSEVFLLSHLKGKTHQEAVKKYREQFEANVKFNECLIITDAPADVLHEKKNREKERQKTLRKRCKKIRHRLTSRSDKYSKNVTTEKDKVKKIDSSNKGRILKSIKEIEKLISTQGNGMWPNNAVTMLERNLFEMIRVLEKGNKNDQTMFKEFDGFTILSKIYNLALDLPKNMSPYLPLKCFVVTSNLYTVACKDNVENCIHVLLSNNIVQILDFLFNRLNLIMPNSDDRNGMVVYKADTVAAALMNLSSIVLTNVTPLTMKINGDEHEDDDSSTDVTQHVQDVVSYIVCTGIVDKLAVYCSSVHDNKSTDSFFLLHCIDLLTRLVETRRGKITDKEDCTQLMATLKATELVGAVSMLYAMLLHQDSMSNDAQYCVAVLQQDVVNVIIATLRLYSRVGELNLAFFQDILGAEGISLQVRHIISYLLRYCVHNDGYKDLLHQVIEFIGFFAIHHNDNQMILQSGSTPTVLQQLSTLPFEYFSNPSLVRILFPTLLACCVRNAQNRIILEQELSFQLLEDFKNSPDSKDIPLIELLRC